MKKAEGLRWNKNKYNFIWIVLFVLLTLDVYVVEDASKNNTLVGIHFNELLINFTDTLHTCYNRVDM